MRELSVFIAKFNCMTVVSVFIVSVTVHCLLIVLLLLQLHY